MSLNLKQSYDILKEFNSLLMLLFFVWFVVVVVVVFFQCIASIGRPPCY